MPIAINIVQVEATQMNYDFILDTHRGKLTGTKGEWVISTPEGNQYIVSDESFQKEYEIVKESEWSYEDMEEGYKAGVDMDTVESEEYINSCPRMA